MKPRLMLLLTPFAVCAALLSLGANRDKPATKQGETAVVPFTLLPSNHMVVEAKLNGKGPYRFIFDLGAPVTLLSNRAADASGAIDKKAPKSFLMGTRGEGKVAKVEMGDLVATDLPVIVMDHPAIKALSGFLSKPLDGIIGYTFWAHYRTTIDYKDLKMTFSPVDFEVTDLMKSLPTQLSGPKVAKTIVLAPRALWGLILSEPEGGVSSPGIPIKTVLAGSPSEIAGLKPGDILTSLDGRWTTSIPDTYSAAEKVELGKTVPVVILRDGKEMTIVVTPREGI
ncbi:MAG: trypsin-like serine protease with C-terminal domain [Planctomycetota bacterium]|nr:trypsin-like serine protease with C-terminal domain [Planctomycetota bacterium]